MINNEINDKIIRIIIRKKIKNALFTILLQKPLNKREK